MPSSMCWPLICRRPFLRAGNLCGGEDVRHLAPLEQAALVDPGAEVGRDGDVGRGGDDAVGEVAAGAAEVEHDLAERGLGRLLVAGRRGDRGDGDLAERAVALGAARCGLRSSSAWTRRQGIGADPGERLPFVAFGDAHRVAHGVRPASGSSAPNDCPCGPANGRPKPLTVQAMNRVGTSSCAASNASTSVSMQCPPRSVISAAERVVVMRLEEGARLPCRGRRRSAPATPRRPGSAARRSRRWAGRRATPCSAGCSATAAPSLLP